MRKATRGTTFRSLAFLSLLLATMSTMKLTASAQQPAARPDRGMRPAGSYAISDIENIDLVNGNLSLSIPLASLPPIAGGKLSYGLTAVYNSKHWDVGRDEQIQTEPPVYNIVRDTVQPKDFPGWRIQPIYNFVLRDSRADFDWELPNCDFLSGGGSDPDCGWFRQGTPPVVYGNWHKWYFITPDGAEHEMKPAGPYGPFTGGRGYLWGYYKEIPDTVGAMTFYSFDGSYIWLRANPTGAQVNWEAFLPDGTKIVKRNGGLERITDPNGNQIEIRTTFDGAGNSTLHIQDALTLREVTKQFIPGTGNSFTERVSYQTVGGDWVSIDVVYEQTQVFGKTYITALHPELQGNSCTLPTDLGIFTFEVIRKIVLPTTETGVERKFQFTYTADSDPVPVNLQYWTFCDTQSLTIYEASNGWGALSRMETPSGATVDYTYSLTSMNELNDPNNLARERVQTKTVSHDGTTETWDYTNGVLGPDGSLTRQFAYPQDGGWPGNYGGSNGLGGLVYKVDYSGKKIVERRWIRKMFDTANAIVSVGQQANFNAVVSEEYTTVVGTPSKMTATTFEYDFNGNLTKGTQYDWFDPALVTRDQDTANLPQGVPQGVAKVREVNNTYHNDAAQPDSANVYAKRLGDPPTPYILNAVKETTAGNGAATLSKTRFHYDLQGFNTAPIAGNVTMVRRDNGGVWIDMNHSYDGQGNRLSTTDPNGHLTTFVYGDATHAQPTQIKVYPDANNLAVFHSTTIVYDYSTGLVMSQTDPNGNATSTIYDNQLLSTPSNPVPDPFGRPGIVTDPQGRKAVTSYHDNDRKLETRADLSGVGDGLLKTRITSDRIGRVIKTESSEDGVTYAISSETIYKYKPAGQNGMAVFTRNPHRSASGELTDGWTRATQDALGRTIDVATFSGSSTPPDSGCTTGANCTGKVATDYNSIYSTVTDQADKQRRSVVDALGRLVRVDEPTSSGLGSVTSPNQKTEYFYDALGNLTLVQQGGQQRIFVYDALSRLTSAKNPEQVNGSGQMVATTYAYYDNGNLQTKTDARGVIATYTYDGLNRVLTRTYSGESPSPATPNVTYGYDAAGVANSKGRLTSVSSSVSSYSYGSYDVMGRVLTGTQTTDGHPYTMSYLYNLAGGMTSETYPSNKVVVTEYDSAGRIAGVKKDSTTYYAGGMPGTANAMSYTPHGGVSAMRLGNGKWEHTNYNSRLQPELIGLGTLSSDSSLLKLDYTYITAGQTNNNGNVRTQTITIGAGTPTPTTINQSYDYDSLNRLSSATESGAWTQTYDCDRYGNRAMRIGSYIPLVNVGLTPLSANSTDFSAFNQTTNRLNKNIQAQANVNYDFAGNLSHDAGSGGYSYDAENRLTNFNGAAGQYFYDGDGHRVKKIDNGGTTVFVYNAGGQLIAEYHSDPVPSPAGGGGTSYLTTDHLGSTRAVTGTNPTQPVKARYDYLPFGEELGSGIGGRTVGMGYSAADSTKQKFTQKERDNESGLDYFLARYYSSAQGRFTSPDDIRNDSHVGDPQSWNRYAYVRNNPLYYTDPTGKDANVTITTDEEHKKGTITIQASFAIWTSKGSGITDAQMQRAAAEIKQTIEGAWKGSFEKDGIKYDVKTEVSVIVAGSEKGAEKSAANAIELVRGSAIPGEADSYVNKRSFFGGPDTGKWNINNLVSSSGAHEFTHLLGVRDRDSGAYLSNTSMLNDPLVPRHATADDFRWALGGAIEMHRWESRPNVITGNELETRSSPGFSRGAPASYQSTRNVHAPFFRGN